MAKGRRQQRQPSILLAFSELAIREVREEFEAL